MAEPSPNAKLQQRILLWMEHHRVDSISALARELHASRPAVSRAAHALLAAGLVRQAGRRWSLTHGGMEECARLRPKVAGRSGVNLKMLSRALEEQQRMVAAIDPGWLKQIQAQMQTTLDFSSLREAVAMATSGNMNLSGIANLVKQASSNYRALEPVLAQQEAMRATIEQTIRLVDRPAWQDLLGTVPNNLFAQQEVFAQRMLEAANSISPALNDRLFEAILPSRRAMDMLADIVKAAGPTSLAADLTEQALGAYEAFGAELFERVDFKLTDAAAGAFEVSALRAASSVLDSALLPIKSLAELGPVTTADAGVLVLPPTAYRSFAREVEERHEELRVLPSEEVDAELQQTLSLQISGTASRLVEARYACNRRSLLIKGEPIFKPTVETEYISVQLAQHVVEDEDDFRQFAEWMYKYIYESSGSLKRVTDFAEADGIAMSIKFLRNYWDHDMEHGDEKDIVKKYRRIRDIFLELIGIAIPETRSHWQQAQLAILRGTEMLMHTLNRKLASGMS